MAPGGRGLGQHAVFHARKDQRIQRKNAERRLDDTPEFRLWPRIFAAGTPVVKDGVMYITTGQQDIFALDAKTGNLIWEYRTPADPKTPDNKAKRGVALGEGLVFGEETDIRKPP